MNNPNTQEYWDNRFVTDWKTNNGLAQSKYFMQVLVNHLPFFIRELKGISKLDYGCGIGSGTEVLESAYNQEYSTTGFDFAKSACEINRESYPTCFWEYERERLKYEYDLVVCSNVLEHVDNFNLTVNDLLSLTKLHCAILVPYRELNPYGEHIRSISETDFPMGFDVGDKKFIQTFAQVFICRNQFWHGDQLLVVYSRVK